MPVLEYCEQQLCLWMQRELLNMILCLYEGHIGVEGGQGKVTTSHKVPEVVKGGHDGGLDVVGRGGWGSMDGIQMYSCNVRDLGVEDKWREGSRGLKPRTLHIPTHTYCLAPASLSPMGAAVSRDMLELGTMGRDLLDLILAPPPTSSVPLQTGRHLGSLSLGFPSG